MLSLSTVTSKRHLGVCQILGASAVLKVRRPQIAPMEKGLAWKAVAQPHLPMALLAQRHRDWGCLLALAPQTSNVVRRSLPGSFHDPAPKMRKSPDSLHPEGASLERSASSVHGTARTEAQRLGLLACLATSNFKRSPEVPAGLLSRPCSKNAEVSR